MKLRFLLTIVHYDYVKSDWDLSETDDDKV
jgi:hypothetical protein